jgi:anthranilate/para-aminobenzoate synthase component I
LIQKDLYHLYSEISGDLRDGVDHLKTIETLFPSGSICGCPKLKSAQKILDCESHDRGIYTGMIGFVSADEEVTSVAIRTGFSHEGFHYFSTGGGIVYDSVPFEEWQETLLKAESFLRFF